MTEELGRKIVEQKQQEMEKGAAGKDLLSLLMRANSSPDVKPEDRLDDAMVIAQICTFMLAGNETSSTALTWCLWRLALNPDIQNKLREEVRAVQEEQPSLDTLYKLPYLDNVVHESLRLDAPVPITTRMAAVDTTIPLSLPHRDRNGKTIDSITVNKGTIIDIRESHPPTLSYPSHHDYASVQGDLGTRRARVQPRQVERRYAEGSSGARKRVRSTPHVPRRPTKLHVRIDKSQN